MKKVILFGYLLFSSNAMAAVKQERFEYCGNLKKLTTYVDTCSKNVIFTNTGFRCLIKFHKESKTAAALLKKNLASGGDGQNLDFSDNGTNLEKADQSLGQLLKKTAVAIEDINYYLVNLVHPEELYELPPEADPNQFLLDSKCFGDSLKGLLFSLKQFEKKAIGISRSRRMLASLKGINDQDFANLILANSSSLRNSSANVSAQKQVMGLKKNKSDVTKRPKNR